MTPLGVDQPFHRDLQRPSENTDVEIRIHGSLHHGVSRAPWRWHRVLPRLVWRGSWGGPAFPGQTQDPLCGYFAAVAGQDGQIDADQLQRCLTQSGIEGGCKPFNLETCHLMVSMLDRHMSGMMGFNEFKELWAVLNGWRQHFISFNSDRSGTVDPQELQKALTTMGFKLRPQTVILVAKGCNSSGKTTFGDYIACCVKLRVLTAFADRILVNKKL